MHIIYSSRKILTKHKESCPVHKNAKLSGYSVTIHCTMEDLPLLQSSCWDDFLTLVMLPLKQAWALLLDLHEYLADDCYKLVIFQRLHSWSCLFQNYKNMWNKRTGANGKRLSKLVSSKTCCSQVLFETSFLCV